MCLRDSSRFYWITWTGSACWSLKNTAKVKEYTTIIATLYVFTTTR